MDSQNHPCPSVATLPELATIADKYYDGLLCSAVLMHLPEEELFDASFAIRRVLKEHGRLLLSIPLHDICELRKYHK